MYRPKVNCSDHRWSSKIHSALPGFMNQRKSSDNHKLLSVIAKNANTYKNDFGAFTNARLLQNAHGQILDDIAADWGVNIVDENDDAFKRFQIRFQMMRHRLGPGTNDIKGAIAYLFNIPENMFNIVSTGIKAIKVTELPFDFDTGDKTDLKHQLIGQYIRGLLPPEFQLKEIDYEENVQSQMYLAVSILNSPIIESVWQETGIEENASTITAINGSRTNIRVGQQEVPAVRESANSVIIGHHAVKFSVRSAVQHRKDQ